MVLSVVKEQMNHYRIRKVSDEECKSPLAWWKFMNHNFLMLFLCFDKF
jgi:hypothetical protein